MSVNRVKNDGTLELLAGRPNMNTIAAKADKVTSATNGNLAGLDINGNLTDAGWASDKTTTAVSGNPISITGLKSNQLAIDPIITFEPIQAGSGDPSPSNVRAISGRDQIGILSCGKNLFPDFIESQTYKGITWTKNADSSITVNGTAEGWATRKYSSSIKLKAGTYILSSGLAWSNCYTVYAELAYNDGTDHSINTSSTGEASFTLENDTEIPTIQVVVRNNAAVSNITIKPMLRDASIIDNTFEPYNPITDLTLQFGQTIYGGILDLKNGVLRVDRVIETYDGSEDETWDGSGFTHGIAISSNYQKSQTVIANSFKGVSPRAYSSLNTGEIALNTAYTGINAKYTISGLSDWKTYLASNNLQVVYELATPIEIQLTPHEISLLKDVANVSIADAGASMSFSYHNGELASLADVSQLGETLNILGDNLSNRLKVKALNYLYSGATVAGTVYTVNNAKSVVFGLGDEDSFGGFSIFYVVGNQNICYNMTPTFNASNNTFSFLPTAGNSGAVRFMGIVFYTKK